MLHKEVRWECEERGADEKEGGKNQVIEVEALNEESQRMLKPFS